MSKLLPLAFLALAASASPALAADTPTPVEGCVELSSAHQGMRFGSQYLLVKDGDAHYRLGFGRSCGVLAASGSITIATNGEANKLCASDTTISNKRGSCQARTVEAIDAATFDRYKRRR